MDLEIDDMVEIEYPNGVILIRIEHHLCCDVYDYFLSYIPMRIQGLSLDDIDINVWGV
jgi:hypothetical protein